MAGMTIKRLAEAGGVGIETIRYYQRRGLLRTPDRPAGGVRRYDDGEVRRLRFIRAAQGAGFTLEEIRALLALDPERDRARVREMAAARIAALDARIAALSGARRSLARLARNCAAEGGGPCPILDAFTPMKKAPADEGRGHGVMTGDRAQLPSPVTPRS